MSRTLLQRSLLVAAAISVSSATLSAQLFGHGNRDKLERLIASVPKIAVRTATNIPTGPGHTDNVGRGKDRRAIDTSPWRMTNTLESLVAFDPNAGVLWPGNMIAGASLSSGILTAIEAPRTPLTLTVTGLIRNSPDAPVSETVQAPSNSTVQQAIQRLTLANVAAAQPAVMSFDLQRAYSLEEALLKLGASYEWLTGDMRARFDAHRIETHTTYVVKFVQRFYTVSVNDPVRSSAYFNVGKTKVDQLRKWIYKGDEPGENDSPPTYVSNVSYGRMLYVFVSSDASAEELGAALHASFNGAVASGSLDINAQRRALIANSQVQVLAIGGGGPAAASVITGASAIDSLNSYIRQGATFDPRTTPAAPIAYQLRYLVDNTVARLSFTTDYTIRTDRPNPARIVATQRIFHTEDDDKDRDDAITEQVLFENQLLMSTTHSEHVRYYDDTTQPGNFMTLAHSVSMNDCSRMTYRLGMENNDGWHLRLTVIGRADDGYDYVLLSTPPFQMANGQPRTRDYPLSC